MITRVDAARICACAEEAERAVDKLREQVFDLLADDDAANPRYAQIEGAAVKAGAAKRELDKAMELALAARESAS